MLIRNFNLTYLISLETRLVIKIKFFWIYLANFYVWLSINNIIKFSHISNRLLSNIYIKPLFKNQNYYFNLCCWIN